MKTIQYRDIVFYLNDKLITARTHPEQTALDLIRNECGLTGIKESCAEGDCGSCTIALGRFENEKFTYRAITSCILPAAKLHKTHVITTEGLEVNNKLHLIQQMILKHHGTQCGYCTPGIIMSLFCLLANNKTPTREDILTALDGNLCRCTGYVHIYEASHAIVTHLAKHPNEFEQILFPPYLTDIQQKITAIEPSKTVYHSGHDLDKTETYYMPSSLNELFLLTNKLQDKYKFINGGTDTMVFANIHNIHSKNLIDIAGINELNFISQDDDKILIGGNITFTQAANNKLIKQHFPELCRVILQMASTQIRNIGTLAGNIANASPIADTACALLALNATLIIQHKKTTRRIPMDEFYKGYKNIDLKPDEIINSIEIPIKPADHIFEKSSKRTAVDISTISSFINITYKHNLVKSCRIAIGGAAAFPTLATECAKFLINKELDDNIINEAATIAMNEFTPISDVRGSSHFRSTLIKNHIIKGLSK